MDGDVGTEFPVQKKHSNREKNRGKTTIFHREYQRQSSRNSTSDRTYPEFALLYNKNHHKKNHSSDSYISVVVTSSKCNLIEPKALCRGNRQQQPFLITRWNKTRKRQSLPLVLHISFVEQ